jgi:hypothetical protein
VDGLLKNDRLIAPSQQAEHTRLVIAVFEAFANTMVGAKALFIDRDHRGRVSRPLGQNGDARFRIWKRPASLALTTGLVFGRHSDHEATKF